LDSVLTDLMGKSGRAMLEALIAGETNPAKLAGLARFSQDRGRIGAANQRKLLCHNDFCNDSRKPRCGQSVAQNCLILEG